jgi:hypothetical protein
MATVFVGDSHRCYADALAMTLGTAGPGESVIEALTGSAFGMYVDDRGRPLFSARRWNPERGMNAAISALGWECERIAGDWDAALEALRHFTRSGPVLAGPFEMGILPHHPGIGKPIAVDHYLTVLGFEDNVILMNDPLGHPYTTVPVDSLFTAWQTKTLAFTIEPYSLRGNFRRVRDVDTGTAVRQMLLGGLKYLEESSSAEAAEAAAEVLERGLNTELYFYLAAFEVCAAVCRRTDAAELVSSLGYAEIAATLDYQARLIGSIQYLIVSGDTPAAATVLRKLAPTFDQLRLELAAAINAG